MQFSVIIPVYNVEKYLSQCIDSVLKQDFTDYEIILVDDGSTDNSPNICDEYAEKYTQIKVIHKTNGGLSDARNFGIKEAQGDYLIFLDSDDFWKGKSILSEIRLIIDKKNPDLIIHSFTYFYTKEKYIEERILEDKNELSFGLVKDLKKLINNNVYYPTAWNKIIRTEIVKSNSIYFPKGKLHEDIAWCADIIPYIDKYAIYNKSFYFYRQEREGAITNKIHKKNIIDILNIIAEKQEELSKIEGGLNYLYAPYIACLNFIPLLDKNDRESCFGKLQDFKFLIDFHPKNTSLKTKTVLLIYKILGIRYGCFLVSNVKKILKNID